MLLKARKVTKFRAMILHFGLKWRKIALRVEVGNHLVINP